LGNARRRLHPAGFSRCHRLGIEVESADVMPGFCQVSRHGPTHVPKTYPSDYCHGESSFASCAGRYGRKFPVHHHTLLECNQGEKSQTLCALMHTRARAAPESESAFDNGFEPAAESG